jgi:hypothetical protein
MTHDELRGIVADVLAITSLNNQRTLATVLDRVNGTSAEQCLAAALAEARELARRVAELEHEVADYTSRVELLEDENKNLNSALERALSARTTKANATEGRSIMNDSPL